MENSNVKQIIETNFWAKCIEKNCNKHTGFDYKDFFTNDFELGIFVDNILPKLLENNHIEKPPRSTNLKPRYDRVGRPIIKISGLPSSVYFLLQMDWLN